MNHLMHNIKNVITLYSKYFLQWVCPSNYHHIPGSSCFGVFSVFIILQLQGKNIQWSFYLKPILNCACIYLYLFLLFIICVHFLKAKKLEDLKFFSHRYYSIVVRAVSFLLKVVSGVWSHTLPLLRL